MSKLKYGIGTASAIAAFVGIAGLAVPQALAGEHSQASLITERAKNEYAIRMQECGTLKNSQPDAYEPCLEKARSTRDNLLTQTQGSEDAGQGSQGVGSNQSQQQFSRQEEKGPIDKMSSAVKETVAEVKEFFGSDQGREGQQQGQGGQSMGQGQQGGGTQGQHPLQQGFDARQMQGQGSGQGGQSFGQQGVAQGQQGQQGQSGQGSFQGQQPQGQSGQGSFQGGYSAQQPQGQSGQQGTGGTNQQFQSGGTQGSETEYEIQKQECNTLKNSQPGAYEACLQKAQSMRDKLQGSASNQSQQQFSGKEQGPIDKMTSAVKETVADVKEKLFGSSDQGREGQASAGQQGQSGQGSFQGDNYGQQPQAQGQSGQQGTQQFQSGGTQGLQGSSNQQGESTGGWAGEKQGAHMDRGEYYQVLARQQYVTLKQECNTLKQDPNVYEQCQKHAESVREKILGMAEQGDQRGG